MSMTATAAEAVASTHIARDELRLALGERGSNGRVLFPARIADRLAGASRRLQPVGDVTGERLVYAIQELEKTHPLLDGKPARHVARALRHARKALKLCERE
jgi:hypothetical protein